MASVLKSQRSPRKSGSGRPLKIALGAALFCGVVAGSVWGVASTLTAMREASRTLAEGPAALITPRSLQVARSDAAANERRVKIAKFSSLSKFTGMPLDRTQLASAADRLSHQRQIDVQVALTEQKKKAEQARIAAAQTARTSKMVASAETTNDTPSMAAALVEDTPKTDLQPFNLVLAKPETEEELTLPTVVPLPEAKPLIETASLEREPAAEKPIAPKTLDSQDDSGARAKPKRSLFSDLFGGGAAERGWPGKNTKVAIYDVSNATVYLPDGTKLRAHSGIGPMRDNPRFEHVKMNGPTPAGIYRLSMREKRFYGVEAIRMTSIDGRDPKNRTGLLTHTNLLRGRIGSHGCVAFQNYEPFLRAFKRGQVNMMVVVPELPSRNQLAALYRKAGA
jgi:hypothetical protein